MNDKIWIYVDLIISLYFLLQAIQGKEGWIAIYGIASLLMLLRAIYNIKKLKDK